MSIAIVGIDSVALSIATLYAARGYEVAVADTDPNRAARFASIQDHVDSDLVDRCAEAMRAGTLRLAGSIADAVRDRKAVVIHTPLAIDSSNAVDRRALASALDAIGTALGADALVVVESLVGIGDMRGFVRERLASAAGKHRFHLAYSPRRCGRGHVEASLAGSARVVGGIDEASTALALAFYRHLQPTSIVPVERIETAELTALVEIATRDLNQAFANAWAREARAIGADPKLVAALTNTQPMFPMLDPGLVAASHETALASGLLAERGFEFARLVRRENAATVAETCARFEAAIGGLAGNRVLVLGRPALADGDVQSDLFARLEAGGAVLVSESDATTTGCAAVIVCDGSRSLFEFDAAARASWRAVLDCENGLPASRVRALGVEYVGIGR